jgi:hypothetical protein
MTLEELINSLDPSHPIFDTLDLYEAPGYKPDNALTVLLLVAATCAFY